MRLHLRSFAAFAVASALAGCSSGGSGSPSAIGGGGSGSGGGSGGGADTPEVTSDTIWNDGKTISSPVVIDAKVTVTIAAGATIKAIDGIEITVKGTLKSAGGAQAKIASAQTGQTWTGILVAPGGTLQLSGVDLENAVAPIDVQGGALAASYDNGTITGAKAPFVVEAKGKLTTSHAKVIGSVGTSIIQGELDASYLDYDANGHDGITAQSDDAIVSVEDSELHGNGTVSDMIVSYQGAGHIHVAYTEIKNVHCAFHLERVTNLDVSHVTAQGDSYGMMLFGSLNTGTRTFTSMNIAGEKEWGIDEQDGSINGPITITDSYIANNTLGDVYTQTGSVISVVNRANAPIADAKPR